MTLCNLSTDSLCIYCWNSFFLFYVFCNVFLFILFLILFLFERVGVGAGVAFQFCLYSFNSCWYDGDRVSSVVPFDQKGILRLLSCQHIVTFATLFYLFSSFCCLEFTKMIFLCVLLYCWYKKEICSRRSMYVLIISGIRQANIIFTTVIANCLMCITFATWLSIILLCSGDIHPNQGPTSTSLLSSTGSSASNMSTTVFNHLSLNNILSFVHYNVQSVVSKLDILHTELFDFDILAFTEAWLNPTVDSDDLPLLSYNKPERKDGMGAAWRCNALCQGNLILQTSRRF